MEHQIRNQKSKHVFLLLLSLALATVALLPLTNESKRINACFISRASTTPAASTYLIPLPDSALHDYSVKLLWLSLLIVSFVLPKSRTRALHTLSVCTLWFHATYILLAACKALLSDFNCAGRHPQYPNGMSGHYTYFIFVMLTLPLIYKQKLCSTPSSSSSSSSSYVLYFTWVTTGLFFIGGVVTLYRTFFHGYHSLRQILLGSALGTASHVMLDIFHFHHELTLTLNGFIVLLSNSLLVIAFYLRVWPVASADPAISTLQFVFHASLLLIIGTSGWLLRKGRKEATD